MGLHLIELHSINCCLNSRIKPNRNTAFFKKPMKINKNTANACVYYEKYEK